MQSPLTSPRLTGGDVPQLSSPKATNALPASSGADTGRYNYDRTFEDNMAPAAPPADPRQHQYPYMTSVAPEDALDAQEGAQSLHSDMSFDAIDFSNAFFSDLFTDDGVAGTSTNGGDGYGQPSFDDIGYANNSDECVPIVNTSSSCSTSDNYLQYESDQNTFAMDAVSANDLVQAFPRVSSGSSAQGTSMAVESTDEDIAAARLQAFHRGIVARKAFARVRKQALASAVIQKHLVSWWKHRYNPADGQGGDASHPI